MKSLEKIISLTLVAVVMGALMALLASMPSPAQAHAIYTNWDCDHFAEMTLEEALDFNVGYGLYCNVVSAEHHKLPSGFLTYDFSTSLHDWNDVAAALGVSPYPGDYNVPHTFGQSKYVQAIVEYVNGVGQVQPGNGNQDIFDFPEKDHSHGSQRTVDPGQGTPPPTTE